MDFSTHLSALADEHERTLGTLQTKSRENHELRSFLTAQGHSLESLKFLVEVEPAAQLPESKPTSFLMPLTPSFHTPRQTYPIGVQADLQGPLTPSFHTPRQTYPIGVQADLQGAIVPEPQQVSPTDIREPRQISPTDVQADFSDALVRDAQQVAPQTTPLSHDIDIRASRRAEFDLTPGLPESLGQLGLGRRRTVRHGKVAVNASKYQSNASDQGWRPAFGGTKSNLSLNDSFTKNRLSNRSDANMSSQSTDSQNANQNQMVHHKSNHSETSQQASNFQDQGHCPDEPMENRKQRLHWVNGDTFDYVTAFMVVLNAIAVGAQTDYLAKEVSDYPSGWFRFIDVVFCVIFAAELLLRICALRSRFFCVPAWRWNVFDSVLVPLQVIDTVLMQTLDHRLNFSYMRVVRLLRTVRVVRMIRVLRMIPELRTIVASIMGSVRSLLWTLVLLFMLVYVFAVFLTQQVTDFRASRQGEQETEDDANLAYFFSGLARTTFSLYQAISGGIDWEELTGPLMSRISVSMALVFGTYTALCMLALMNVVTGVFVESALESAKKDRTAYMLQHVRHLFADADPENTGNIGWERFESSLDKPFMREFFEAIDVDVSDANSVFALLDTDDSGEIDLDEFLNGCLGLHGPAQAIHLATLMYESRISSRFLATSLAHLQGVLQHIILALPRRDISMTAGTASTSYSPPQHLLPAISQRRAYEHVFIKSDGEDIETSLS